jgi:hypothetical protein
MEGIRRPSRAPEGNPRSDAQLLKLRGAALGGLFAALCKGAGIDQSIKMEVALMRRMLLLSVALLFAAALSLPAARAGTEKGQDIEQEIANAKTAADHEKIAAFYEGEATAAEKDAEEHDRMAASYKKVGGALIGKLHLDQHCADISKRYREVAKNTRDLAAAHREMAKQAK